MATYFAVPANYAAFAQGATVNGTVQFTPNENGVALDTSASPPLGWIASQTQGSIVNGNLQTSPTTSSAVYLLGQTSDLNLSGTLQYAVSFEVTVGTQPVPMAGFTFDAQTPRTTSDGATTNNSTALTSATANFTANDVGAVVTVAGSVASGTSGTITTIVSVTNSTTAVLSNAATATVTGAALSICQPVDLITVTPAAAASAVVALSPTTFGTELVQLPNAAALISLLGLGGGQDTYLGTAASQAAMLALTGVEGNWTIRTDTTPNTVWYLTGSPASSLSSWTELPTIAVTNNSDGTLSVAGVTVKAPLTAQSANITASTAPTIGQINVYDDTSGSLTPTLNALSTYNVGATMIVQKYTAGSLTNTVTVTCHSGDTFDNGSTSRTLKLQGEFEELQVISISGTKHWKVISDGKTLSSLDKRYTQSATHTAALSSQFLQMDSGRVYCGVYANGATKHYWVYNSSTAYQQDSDLTDLNTYTSMSLPTNIVTSHGIRIVAPAPGQPGAGYMYLLGYNSSTNVFELYRATLVTKGTSPSWSSKLLSLQTNATLIGSNLRATASGIFVGEYTGGSDISAGPKVYRSTDGTTFSSVLSLPGSGTGWTRHIHGVFEDTFTGDIYVTVGDGFSPYSPAHYVYHSTNGGASFTGVTTLDSASAQWQCVSMGFTADYIYFASDQTQGGGSYYCDRATMTPRWMSLLKHDKVPVLGAGGRSVTTLATNSNTTIGLSGTYPDAFSAADVGRLITGPNEIADGTYITAVASGTSATITPAATGTNTGDVATISDAYFSNAFMGAVDPATGFWYVFAVDTSSSGNVGGLFVYAAPGSPPILRHAVHNMTAAAINSQELMILNGLAWIGRYGYFTLPTP